MRGRDWNGPATRVEVVAFAMPSVETSLKQGEIARSTSSGAIWLDAADAVVHTAWLIREGLESHDLLQAVAEQVQGTAVPEVLLRLVNASDWKGALCRDQPEWGPGHGFALRSPLSAIYLAAMRTSFLDTVREAIELGDDADTTAAIAGALAACRHLMEAIDPGFLAFEGFNSLLLWDSSSGPQTLP